MTERLHPDTEIGCVYLKVSNLESSIAFYRDVIGFQVLQKEEKTVELTADGQRALLVLHEIPNAVIPSRRTSTGLYHFAILVPSRRALGLSLRNLIRHEIRIGSSDHLVSEALYLNDPDMNGIEIYADRPREQWQLDAGGEVVMAVDPLDLEDLVRQADDHSWTGLHADTTIGHVHLHVADLMQAKEFYTKYLGFDTTAHYGDSALFVSAGGYHHHIGLNTWAGVGAPKPPADAVGLAYYTILQPDADELEAFVSRLQQEGISAVKQVDAWIIEDPFGIGIRIESR